MLTTTITINGQALALVMNTHALYHLEEKAGKNYNFFLTRLNAGVSGAREVIHVFWALLEGARVAQKQPIAPWNLSDVLALVDSGGGYETFFDEEGPHFQAIRDAFAAGFPVTKKRTEQEQEAERRRLEGAATEERPTSQTAASIGSSSSTAPLGSASPSATSGASPSASSIASTAPGSGGRNGRRKT